MSERKSLRRPSPFARAALWLFLPARLRESIMGDLEEQWHETGGRGYWRDALRSISDCWRTKLDALFERRDSPRRGFWIAFGTDLRFSIRLLTRNPGFALAAVLTLAIGIGGSTAIFSTVKPALFEPLPYPEADRIVSICDRTQNGTCLDVTFGTYREVLARNRSFEHLAVIRPWQPVLTGLGEAERLDGQRVSPAYFDVLGVRPAIGRPLNERDDRVGAPRVAVLADALWRRRFNADPGVLGREITLGDVRYTIVGVLPRTFENIYAPTAQLWTALQYDLTLPVDGKEWGHHLRMAGRLRAGVSLDAAAQDLDAIARSPIPEMPRVGWASLSGGFLVSELQEELTREIRPVLLAFSAAVALVLIIASANVANLLLARALHRRREFAVRAALGAGRGRLVRQLLTEALIMSAAGGALGALAAHLGVEALVSLRPSGLLRLDAIGIDRSALLFALAVSTLVGIAIAIFPALHSVRGDLQPALQQNTRTTAGGHCTMRQTLVVAEVALALMLLVSAGLLFRSLQTLVAISPGFDPQGLTVAQVQAVGARFRDGDAWVQFFDRAAESIAALPGVRSAAQTNQLPLSGDLQRFGVQIESAPRADPNADQSAFRYVVGPGYFDTMRIPLKRGRLLDPRDRAGAPLVAVVSERLVARRFGGVDPIGQRVRVGGNDTPWLTIVGVVGDVKQTSLGADDAEAVYLTPAQAPFREPAMWMVVRAPSRQDLAADIRATVGSIDKDQPVVRMSYMTTFVSETTADRRFALMVFGVFGAVALLLAITGLYSALSRSVAERTREIGVRAALGASRREVLSMILRQGLALTGVGVAAGVVGAVLATRMLETLLFDMQPTDPATYAGAAGLFMAIAMVASMVPALRAVSIDPAITLRAE